MANKIRIALAHNNTGGLADLIPQPATPYGVRYQEYVNNGIGNQYGRGDLFIELEYSSLKKRDFLALLTTLGLLGLSNQNGEVTARLPDGDFIFKNYNGKVKKPIPEKDYKYRMGLYKDIKIVITELVQI